MVAALVVVLPAVASCGSGEDVTSGQEDAAEAESLVDLEVSSADTAVLASLDDVGAIAIDTAASAQAGRQVVATWVADDERTQAADTDRPPLVYPSAWSAGTDVYVFGAECPEVDLELVSDIDFYSSDQVCGVATMRRVVRHLDTTTSTWREVAEAPAAEDGKAFLLGGTGDQALVRTAAGSVSTIDLGSGEVASLADVVLRDANLGRACAVDDGSFLVVATTAPPPGTPGRAVPEQPLSAWSVRDGGSQPLALPEGLDQDTFGPVECLPGRGVLGPVQEGVVEVLAVDDSGVLQRQELPLPDGAADVPGLRLQSSPPQLVLWVPEGEGLVPWSLTGDGPWSAAGETYPLLDPPAHPVVVDEHLLALATSYGEPATEDGPPTAVTRVVSS
ncbi:MAG TPA: hypothetical protein VK507_15870 [Iamia sp.]|nr:hypothetical protein [Iamia sp.]